MKGPEERFYTKLLNTLAMVCLILFIIILGVKIDDYLEAKGYISWL